MSSTKSRSMLPPDKGQSDKFAELARALECDEDEAAFDAKLREVAKHKPVHEESE